MIPVLNLLIWNSQAYLWVPHIILYICLLSLCEQNDIYEWARDHRVHHKYSETDADPHNAKRGFFFAHIGWLLVRKHPDVIEKGKKLELSDLKADEVVMFQRRWANISQSLCVCVYRCYFCQMCLSERSSKMQTQQTRVGRNESPHVIIIKSHFPFAPSYPGCCGLGS